MDAGYVADNVTKGNRMGWCSLHCAYKKCTEKPNYNIWERRPIFFHVQPVQGTAERVYRGGGLEVADLLLEHLTQGTEKAFKA